MGSEAQDQFGTMTNREVYRELRNLKSKGFPIRANTKTSYEADRIEFAKFNAKHPEVFLLRKTRKRLGIK